MKHTITTNEGYKAEITYENKAYYATFLDTGYKKKTHSSVLTRFNVKNPYHKSVYGIGYLGAGEYDKVTKHKEPYKKWRSMINRCYVDKNSYEYGKVTICEEWLNFQNFAGWYYKNTYNADNEELDKDILSETKNIYSPQTCCLIPKELNLIMSSKKISKDRLSKLLEKYKNQISPMVIKTLYQNS